MRKEKPVLIWLFMILILAVIWGNSMRTFEASHQMSQAVTNALTPFCARFFGCENISDLIVRKSAHFFEYSVLGCGLIGVLSVKQKRGPQMAINCLFAGLAVAVIDESIQIFSDRGSSVADVLLDFAGVSFGTALALLIRRFVSTMKRNRTCHR